MVIVTLHVFQAFSLLEQPDAGRPEADSSSLMLCRQVYGALLASCAETMRPGALKLFG